MSGWRRGTIAVLIPVGIAVAVFALGTREPPVLTDHAGYPVYRKHCKRCHGNRGDARKASRIAGHPVDLIDPAFRDTTRQEDIEVIVLRGKGKMEGYAGKLGEGDAAAVSRYVLALPPRSEEPAGAGP